MTDITLLRHFVAVAQRLSFTRAAALVHSNQSVVSRSVKRLEDEVGTRLIERSTRNVVLTPAGEAYLRDALAILNRLAVATGNARRIGEGGGTAIRIAVCATVDAPELTAGLRAFRADWPDVALSFQSTISTLQPGALRAASAEVGIMQMDATSYEGLEWQVLTRRPMVVAVPPSWGFPIDRPIRIAELAGRPFIMPRYETAPGWHDAVFDICKRAGFEPVIAGIADDPLSARMMLGCGIGATFTHASGPGGVQGDVQIVQLADATVRPPADTVAAWAAGTVAEPIIALVRHLAIAFEDATQRSLA